MADFLTNLSALMGGQAAPAVQAPPISPAQPTNGGSSPQVLATLRPPISAQGGAPGNPLGLSAPIGGNDFATALSGLAQVNPHSSRFGAFAQGLSGAMSARTNANFENAKLGIQQDAARLQATKVLQDIQMNQNTMDARARGAAALQGVGAPAAPMQASAPAMAPMQLPGGATPDSAPVAPATPASPAGPTDAAAPAPKMIPHAVAAQPDFWSNVNPDSNPAYIDNQAAKYERAALAAAGDPETAKRYGDTANQYRQRAAQIRQSGMVTLNDGSQALIPGFATSKATAAAITKAAETNAEQSIKDQHELVEAQPVPGGPTIRVPKSQVLGAQPGSGTAPALDQGGAQPPSTPAQSGGVGLGSPPGGALPTGVNIAKQPAFIEQRVNKVWEDEDKMGEQFHARQDAIGRIQQMQGILAKYESGAFADKKAEALAALKATTGIDLGQETVDNYQEFQKLATKSVFNDVKAMGGRVLVSEIEGLTRANANPNLQPGANQAILGSALGALRREDQYYHDFTKWHAANPTAYDTSQFEQDWNKANPAISYAEQGIHDTPAKGIPIPSRDKLVDGQSYVNARGQVARWNAQAGHFEAAE